MELQIYFTKSDFSDNYTFESLKNNITISSCLKIYKQQYFDDYEMLLKLLYDNNIQLSKIINQDFCEYKEFIINEGDRKRFLTFLKDKNYTYEPNIKYLKKIYTEVNGESISDFKFQRKIYEILDFNDTNLENSAYTDYILTGNTLLNILSHFAEIIEFIASEEIKINSFNPLQKYNKEILSTFKGQSEIIDLIYYFNDNFEIIDKRGSNMTKYNQIYFYLNELSDSNPINKKSYIKFIRENFFNDYNPTRINGRNQDHQFNLKKLADIFFDT